MSAGRPLARAGLVMTMVMSFAGCEQGRTELAADEPSTQTTHVDSVFPIDEEVRRFRAALDESVDSLAGGFDSPDSLVAHFMTALEARDADALQTMALTPAEFIDLYYPHTRFTAPPYEMSPGLVWFQLENYGGKGLNRALDRFGGRPLGYVTYACDEEKAEGPNTLLSGCTVSVVGQAAEPHAVSLFGTIIGRDGRWKFVNYANGL